MTILNTRQQRASQSSISRSHRMLFLWVFLAVMFAIPGRVHAQSYGFWFTQKAAKTVPFGKSIPVHGAASKFQFAPAIPAWPSSDWKLVEAKKDPEYKEPSRHCGTATECLKAADFAFFLTELRLPKGASVQSFKLRASKFDEGIRTTIYNARYPKGISPTQGFLRLDQLRAKEPHIHTATTGEMASYLEVGGTNIIVITVLDDCCSAIALDKVEMLYNGKVLTSRNNAPILVSKPPPYALTTKPFRYLVRMWDYDDDAVEYRLLDGPQGATIEKDSGWVTWKANPSQLGKSFSFSVEACDTNAACRRHAWSVVVAGQSQNLPPSITSLPLRQVQPLRNYRYKLKIEDGNAWDWVSLTFLKKPTTATIVRDVDAAYITWKPAAGSAGSSSPFAVRACDLEGACIDHSWLVTVTPNRAPKIANSPSNLAVFGQEYKYAPTVVDPDVEETFLWKMVDGPPVYFFPKTGRIVWKPKKEHLNKTWQMVLEVCDRDNACAQKKWDVRVDEPVVAFQVSSNPPIFGEADKLYEYQVKIDPDSVALASMQVELKQAPTTAVFDASTGTVRWTPKGEDAGQKHDFVLSLCKQGKCITQTWQVEIAALNEKPLISSKAPKQGYMLTLYTYVIKAADQDSKDPLYYKLLKGPEGVTVDISTGVLNWTPRESDAEKTFDLSIAACDLKDACTTQDWRLPVSRNRPPQIASKPGAKATSEVLYQYPIKATDPDVGDELSYKLVKSPTGASIDGATLSWTPADGDKDFVVEFSLSVCDQDGVCVTQDWKVEVDVPNKSPQISSKPGTTATIKQVYRYSIKASDPNVGDSLRLQLVKHPEGATLEGQDIRWMPGDGQVGVQAFLLRLCDSQDTCIEQEWQVTVKSAPATPPKGCRKEGVCGPEQVCSADGNVCEPKGTTPPEPPKTGCSSVSVPQRTPWLVLLLLPFFVGLRRRQ